MKDQHVALQEGFSSDEGESGSAQACLLFEYLERDQPYGREPLSDKVKTSLFTFTRYFFDFLSALKDISCAQFVSFSCFSIFTDIGSCPPLPRTEINKKL